MASAGTRKPILISGAGLASLLFAQALLRARIPFLIFERDASVSFRAQGYRLRLSDQGLDAISSVLTPEKFQRFWAVCGKTGGAAGGFGVLNAVTGEPLFAPPPNAGAGKGAPDGDGDGDGDAPPLDPEAKGGSLQLASRSGKVIGIARGEMRQEFLEGCEDYIRWSHTVTGYESTESGVRLVFADGSKSEEGDMIVGGEGIYSKVARQVSKGAIKTYDTGARGIHGQASTTAFKGLGEGVWRLVDDRVKDGKVAIITNVRPNDMDDPTVEFGWTMGAQPGVINPPNNDHTIVGSQAADIAKALTADWAPNLKPLFDEMNSAEAAFWKITCSSPWGVPEWPTDPRVTVIGDAVHSMTPAGGLGANTALRDSALLGKLITEAGGWKEGLAEAYEKQMRVYGSEAVAQSYGMATGLFGMKIDKNSPVV